MKTLKFVLLSFILCSTIIPAYTQNIVKKYRNYQGFKEGNTFIHKDLITIKGDTLRVADLQNKVVWYNMWFIACKACVSEFQELNRIVEEYKDCSNIEFIALSYDEPEKIRTFLQKYPFNFRIVCISKIELETYYKTIIYPKNLLIDINGYILKEKIGGAENAETAPKVLAEFYKLFQSTMQKYTEK